MVAGKSVTPSVLRWITVLFMALITGRYFDVTVPALFGRGVNLYWDGQQLPRLIWTGVQGAPWWATVLIVLGVPVTFWLLYRVTHWCWSLVFAKALPWAVDRRWTWAVTACLLGLSFANFFGAQATWPFVSKPVTPTYLRQATILATALLPGALERVLPPSPRFDKAPVALKGVDVSMVFLESYGAVAFDNAAIKKQIQPAHRLLEEAIAQSGLQVLSAYVRSATFGGASELAHLSLLSGIDLSDPLVHDLLLTSSRPTLTSWLKSHGYRTVGVYPALSWDWDERKFYAFDRFIDGRDLRYAGPKLGYWWTPDQFTMARIDELEPTAPGSAPRFLFFPTITTHIPFAPVPPIAKDRQKLLSADPFDAVETERAQKEPIDWLKLGENYPRMITYQNQWLAWHLAQPRARPVLYILVGDHQPSSVVSGEGAPWDVPVHILSADPAIVKGFLAMGFKPGLIPSRPILGGIHQLTSMLESVFTGQAPGQ